MRARIMIPLGFCKSYITFWAKMFGHIIAFCHPRLVQVNGLLCTANRISRGWRQTPVARRNCHFLLCTIPGSLDDLPAAGRPADCQRVRLQTLLGEGHDFSHHIPTAVEQTRTDWCPYSPLSVTECNNVVTAGLLGFPGTGFMQGAGYFCTSPGPRRFGGRGPFSLAASPSPGGSLEDYTLNRSGLTFRCGGTRALFCLE